MFFFVVVVGFAAAAVVVKRKVKKLEEEFPQKTFTFFSIHESSHIKNMFECVGIIIM